MELAHPWPCTELGWVAELGRRIIFEETAG